MIKYLLFIVVQLFVFCAVAQNDTIAKVPIDRQYFHDLVTKELKLTDKADGKQDGLLKVTGNDEVHLLLTDVLFRRIDRIKNWVEITPDLPAKNEKVRYLRYIENMLRWFRTDWKKHEFNPLDFPMLVATFFQAYQYHPGKKRIISLM